MLCTESVKTEEGRQLVAWEQGILAGAQPRGLALERNTKSHNGSNQVPKIYFPRGFIIIIIIIIIEVEKY
jgi:hypothetical protein